MDKILSHHLPRRDLLSLLVILAAFGALPHANAFSPRFGVAPVTFAPRQSSSLTSKAAGLFMVGPSPPEGSLVKIPDDDDTPIPFVDAGGASFIECYADSVVALDGRTYTVGSPCDCSVALTFFDKGDQLFPVELDSELMDDVFPVAEGIVEEEFGEELVLQRTPQTLTLVGELEDDRDEDEGVGDDEGQDVMDDEEEVEILLSFEHKGREFHLVRLLDPVLLVGKEDPDSPKQRLLLSPEESDEVMPAIEELFLKYQGGDNDTEF